MPLLASATEAAPSAADIIRAWDPDRPVGDVIPGLVADVLDAAARLAEAITES